MRDFLCIEEKRRKSLALHKTFFEKYKGEIKSLTEDEKNGIQRYPNNNKSIIIENYFSGFRHRINDIRAKYSLGDDIHTLEDYFHSAIDHLESTGTREIGYIYMVWTISLGILLETDKTNLKRLGKIVEKKEVNDAVIDYLLCASDIGWTKITNNYSEESPYMKTREIIELAATDKSAASERLYTYMEKEWLTGHRGYGWKNAHKDSDYVGFWSFETAAIAKILKLDDSALKQSNRYPYDLAHYKKEMTFKTVKLAELIVEEVDLEEGIEGISNNPLLEKVIPIRWHAFINELINAYQQLDDGEFYEKYKDAMGLDEIWFDFDDYVEENKDKNLLGTLIVFALTEKAYILQLDYKENFEDYEERLKNFWKEETKLVQFDLDNDQYYYALVPVDMDVIEMYDVRVRNVI